MTLPTIRHLHSAHDSLLIPGFVQFGVQTPAFAATLTIDSSAGLYVVPGVLTAAMLVAAPTNPFFGVLAGQILVITFIQDGTGGRAVTWNAVFKNSWSDTGNTLNKRSTIAHIYDGTNWNQLGAQTPYV